MTAFACLGVAQTPGIGETDRLINVNPDPGGEPWIAGGITMEEWRKAIAGLPPLAIEQCRAVLAPAKVDNSILPAFRPIFSQKGGSCAQASAIAYVFTYEINAIRGLASNVPEHQYPYDFTYNFLNKGSGSNGSMPADGFSIAKELGIPDVKTYGGFGLAKYSQWISGYDSFYKGMANRADSQFTISSNTPDGINTIRNWFFDRGNGSPQGGCLVFCYNASGSQIVTLASGTPEGGKKAMVKAGTGGGHAVTIAGYNDSVRYDYNGDGKYTIDRDITGDGKVDVRDWETGVLLMVNSWGTSYGNGGKIYVPYKFAAEGMWSGKVYGMRTGGNYVKPLLTYKVVMSHDDRKQIRIRAGYATSASATAPTGTLKSFKAFSSATSGSVFPMQGINGDPIEIGLDVSEFVSKLTGGEASLFLVIDSKGGTGSVKSFSLIDYGEMKDAELVIVTAGQGRRPGVSRLDLISANAKTVRTIVKHAVGYAPDSKLMMVTNPVDVMTYVAYRESGFERNRVFGMGNILDTLRFREYIALELGISREDIRALVIGEHGDSMVPLIHNASVSGIPITSLLTNEQIARISNLTRTSGADVIRLKGSTVFAPAAVIAIMADAVLKGRNRVLGVSSCLQGEYGFSDISIGVPCILGKNGVEKILELELDAATREAFTKSVEVIRETMKAVM